MLGAGRGPLLALHAVGELEDLRGEAVAEGGVVDLVLVVVGAQQAVEAVHLVVQGHGAAGRAAHPQRVDVLLAAPVGDVLPDGAALPAEALLPNPLEVLQAGEDALRGDEVPVGAIDAEALADVDLRLRGLRRHLEAGAEGLDGAELVGDHLAAVVLDAALPPGEVVPGFEGLPDLRVGQAEHSCDVVDVPKRGYLQQSFALCSQQQGSPQPGELQVGSGGALPRAALRRLAER
ncbi:hypothetical protein D0439_22390, partial [Lysinibacillus fusiformis]